MSTASFYRSQVDTIVDKWRSGEPPNALHVLSAQPELLKHRSLAIDLAYEEFCLREEQGEALDPEKFGARFRGLSHSLTRVLAIHRMMHKLSNGLDVHKEIDWPKLEEQWLDWKLVEEIGRGAFSRVYLAEEPSLGNRRVVVKCSRYGASEAFVLGKSAHRNVMPIHSIRTDDDRELVGICMPYLGRVTLAQVLDRVAADSTENLTADLFSPDQETAEVALPTPSFRAKGARAYLPAAVGIVEQVARGLAAAHQLGVLHGDIKPSNILLGFDGHPLILDFNLASDGLSSDGKSKGLPLGGTPPYMAPERLSLLGLEGLAEDYESNRPADFRSDIFSVGIVLHELIFGIPQFSIVTDDDDETAYERTTNPRSASQIDISGRQVPAKLMAIIDRCVEIDPSRRFKTVDEVADELAEFAERLTTQQRRTTLLTWALSLLTILAIAGGGLFGLNRWINPPRNSAQKLLLTAIQEFREKDFVSGSKRLLLLQQTHPRKQFNAWLGYCNELSGHPDVGWNNYDRADPEADLTGELYFHMGRCSLNSRFYDRAVSELTKAIERNPYFGEAYWSSSLAKVKPAMTKKSPIPFDALEDIEAAVSLLPMEPLVALDAAKFHATQLRYDESLRERTLEHIDNATRMGVTRKEFDDAAIFRLAGLESHLPPKSSTAPSPRPKLLPRALPSSFDLEPLVDELE